MAVRDDYHRHSKRVTSTKRWQVLRQAVLERDEWACVDCGTKRGRLEIDHVKPVRTHPHLAFEPKNCATRCSSCHTRKTRIECGHPAPIQSPERQAWVKAVAELAPKAFSIPHGLQRSRIPVIIVCGPPGAGKSTHARAQAKPGDLVIDLDDYLEQVGGVMWDTVRDKVREAFKLREAALRSLSEQKRGRAWLIITAPSIAERQAWARALGRVTFDIHAVAPEICKARILADPRRQHAISEMIAGVDRWWSAFEPNPA